MTAASRPFFLDAGDRGQRLCVFHPAQGVVTPRAQLLWLPPFGEEMNKSRRMTALAARAFAAAGAEVLVMDLLGCGDSDGDFADATWTDWIEDALLGARWLTERLPAEQRGNTPLWLWGLRAGALLAGPVAQGLDRPVDLLLWQPVTVGKLQLQQFLRLKVAADLIGGQAKGALQALRDELDRGAPVEVAGYRLAPALATGLELAQLKPMAGIRRVVWLEVSSREAATLTPAANTAVQAWRTQGAAVQADVVHGPSFWAASEIEEAPQLIEASLQAVFAPHPDPVAA
ncbi:hydrolase 2, exosortase A system-associated [Roseateles amylovorans]|uniref:Hydrolase 2, exosortase A system-associated n=1 Tax=Roseateles amylovorans TaxID=2978473 RepID=A0ABY6B4N4_9BURK|nr:hydrolase 2, exosortase A system-associated [Roseateles amylovorans]UXH80155.1 hydrolase 2, exosortase A system-associated [Roseateles amylovorans]